MPAPALNLTVPVASVTDALRRSVEGTPLDECPSRAKGTKRESKNVRFDTSGTENKRRTPEPTIHAGTNQIQSFATLDLKATKSVCDHLSRGCTSPSTFLDPCLGYLEHRGSALSSRLIFYDASRNTILENQGSKRDRKANKVVVLLQSLRTVHQLTLAYKLAVATLQYHSTSWLGPDWSLEDISYFQNPTQHTTEAIEDQLRSLHLSTQFPATAPSVTTLAMQDQQDLKFVYGIRNLPLAKLGIALLEIGCQSKISDLTTNPAPHDVISAKECFSTHLLPYLTWADGISRSRENALNVTSPTVTN